MYRWLARDILSKSWNNLVRWFARWSWGFAPSSSLTGMIVFRRSVMTWTRI